jgi:hypothetical protein
MRFKMKVIFKSTTDLICKKHIGITGNIEMKNGTLYFFHDGNLLMTVDILQRYSIGQTLYVISYEARYSFLIPSKIKFKKITLPRWTKDVLDYQNNFTSQSYIVVLQNIHLTMQKHSMKLGTIYISIQTTTIKC